MGDESTFFCKNAQYTIVFLDIQFIPLVLFQNGKATKENWFLSICFGVALVLPGIILKEYNFGLRAHMVYSKTYI